MSIRIRALADDDIPFGLSLCAQNRWNQLAPDWQRQLALEPAGCFLAEFDGRRAGTACYCTFGDVAWINLVLVERDQRRQGIGSALLRHVIASLDAQGFASIRLDATALGQPVYAKLGFADEFTLARFVGVPSIATPPADGIESLGANDLQAVCELDQSVTNTSRGKLLRYLVESSDIGRKVAPAGRLEGYCLARPGANAWKIGPLQGSPDACRRLLLAAVRRLAGKRVYIDVPIDNANAVALMAELGFKEERRFIRMGRGPRVVERLDLFWGSFGPEKG